jgi:hypothetical protein
MRTMRTTRQRGAVAVVVAFVLVVLIAVLGLVIDLGHLYIVKTELQNAADSCALAAARELNDLSAGASDRGKAAGVTAGTNNNMDLQGKAALFRAADVTFSASISGPWSDTVDSKTVYARCAPYEKVPYSVAQWITHVGDTNPMLVNAEAIARPVGGKSYCAVPIAMCTNDPLDIADLHKGLWYSGRLGSGTATSGNYDWVRFPGSSGGSDLGDIIAGPGVCSLDAKKVDSEPGVSQGVAQAWNTRFGLYSGSYKDVDQYPPDRTGYAFTKDRYDSKGNVLPGSWPYLVTSPAPPLPAASYPLRAASNAYDGTAFGNSGSWSGSIDPNYTMRKGAAVADPPDLTLLPYDPRALLADNGKPMNLVGNPSPLSGAMHAEKGQDRRMVFMPIIACNAWSSGKKNIDVIDWACAFMLHPINDANQDVELEFRGLASKNECGTTGVPGDFGPPVPALVK